MVITPTFLAFASGVPASDRWKRAGHRAAPNRLPVSCGTPTSGGPPAQALSMRGQNPWAGVVAMRLRRAALASRSAA
jgi:hypothetical protein